LSQAQWGSCVCVCVCRRLRMAIRCSFDTTSHDQTGKRGPVKHFLWLHLHTLTHHSNPKNTPHQPQRPFVNQPPAAAPRSPGGRAGASERDCVITTPPLSFISHQETTEEHARCEHPNKIQTALTEGGEEWNHAHAGSFGSSAEVCYTVAVTRVGGTQKVLRHTHTNNETSNGVTPISHTDGVCDWETYVCIDV